MNVAVENLCDEIRQTLNCNRIPVDVLEIARREKIELAPGSYGPNFNGRIEFLPGVRRFVIYYPESYEFASDVRIRFSVAHELGHYYLEGHRQKLVEGNRHDSNSGFSSDKAMEREADEFAASILIPRSTLDERTKRRGFMTFAEIMKMASDLEVSIPAAVIRYVRYAEEPCCVVVSEEQSVLYSIASDELRARGTGCVRRGVVIPAKAKARDLLASQTHREAQDRAATSEEWFEDGRDVDLWEEAISLGYQNQVITLLSVQKKH